MDYTVRRAQALSGLTGEALAGDEVVIKTDEQGAPVAQLVALPEKGPIRMGWLQGQVPDIGPDSPFFDPLPADELRLWNREGK